MISFQPGQEEKDLRDLAREFAETRLRPAARAAEGEGEPPGELAQAYEELGLGSIALPEALGGAGLGMVAACLVEEELAWGDPGLALALGQRGAALAFAADLLGDDSAPMPADLVGPGALLWPQAPDDPRAGTRGITFTVQAHPGSSAEHALYGRVPAAAGAAHASWLLVAANLGEETALFRVTPGGPGVQVAPVPHPLGLAAAGFGELALEGAEVDAGALLWRGDPRTPALLRARERARLRVAAQLVGTARAALEYATGYAAERQAFGEPIARFQGVSFMVAEMAMEVEAARNLLWQAAWRLDRGKAPAGAAQALLQARAAAVAVTSGGVQVLGGHGYMADHPVEKWMRDARALGVAVFPETALEVEAATELGLGPRWTAPGLAASRDAGRPGEGGAA
ncbi:acyl-CoA dehydrogenase family protein [Limnochorda pilosa]|uniref:Acyl-CoA dehydrogenase n=1 Tax=Limnochorda pilosa TaxID=1555112 RepID=A0A0K2SGB5_LIMPI|nr:acyl-CoA dehydrogenase family protein [Limnochorda pilosa]BAS26082.1 hypothetical protein LIP_0225 [Limnochorda pilosa]